MEEVLNKLRLERHKLFGEISKIDKFRGTDEWKKLSVNHKELLDLQLGIMKVYMEVLTARIIDLEQEINKEEEKTEEPVVKIVKIILDNEKD